MKAKKLLAIMMSVLLVVCTLPTIAGASEGIEVIVSSTECLPGETVVVTVDLVNNPGIASLRFKLFYDEALTLESIVYNTAIGGQSTQPGTMQANPVTLLWVSPFADYSSDATFVTLTFTVSEDATPHSTANIRLTFNPDDIYNKAETNIPCYVTNGKVNIGSINGEDDLYITPTASSIIDYSNQIVFSDAWCETDITSVVNVLANNVNAEPNTANGFIGTGSTLVINKGESTASYNIIIVGDLNGDSVCDVLDAAITQLYSVGSGEPTQNEIYAANGCIEEEIDAADYQNVINWALS